MGGRERRSLEGILGGEELEEDEDEDDDCDGAGAGDDVAEMGDVAAAEEEEEKAGIFGPT